MQVIAVIKKDTYENEWIVSIAENVEHIELDEKGNVRVVTFFRPESIKSNKEQNLRGTSNPRK